MTADEQSQGELFGAGRRVVSPRGGRGDPTETPPGRRRGAQFVADPATVADELKRRQLAEQLERIALEVGNEPDRPAGAFALWHVRKVAEERRILSGEEMRPDPITGRAQLPRALSWLGALLPGMARAGLLEKVTVDGRPQYDTSEGGRAHGNKNVLWRLTPDGREAARWTDFRYYTGTGEVDL